MGKGLTDIFADKSLDPTMYLTDQTDGRINLRGVDFAVTPQLVADCHVVGIVRQLSSRPCLGIVHSIGPSARR